MPDVTRLAFFGGIYSNTRALAAAIQDARRRGADAMYALGDFGAFGPHPDRVFPVLLEAGIEAIQGNYEESLSTGASDCHCGYTDPRDNHFAQLSYDYTASRTSPLAWSRQNSTSPRPVHVCAPQPLRARRTNAVTPSLGLGFSKRIARTLPSTTS